MITSRERSLIDGISAMCRLICAVFLTGLAQVVLADCEAVDFMKLDLPPFGDPVEIALQAAYPAADLDLLGGTFSTPDGAVIPYAPARDIGPAGRLDGATMGDMFIYRYPLDFDLKSRETPWFDPGRIRNEAFFTAMYFATKAQAQSSLQTEVFRGQTGQAGFSMTTKHCVATQLAAALDQIEILSPEIDVFFKDSGGSFNWRVIAGTDRISSHSFGTAIDINTELGGYWRWTGAAEGQVTEYDNKIPQLLVEAMERYGFVWGGKWNNFDGMHFEYRPELILYSRAMD